MLPPSALNCVGWTHANTDIYNALTVPNNTLHEASLCYKKFSGSYKWGSSIKN